MSEAELKEAVVAAAIRYREDYLHGGSMAADYAESNLLLVVKNLLEFQGKPVNDPAIKGADLLTRAGLLEAAENGKELGICDED